MRCPSLPPLLLLAAACASRAPVPPAPPASAPASAGPAPAAPAPAAPAPEPLELLSRCPVGDFTNVAVYGFLERELEEAAAHDGGRDETRSLLASEAALRGRPDMKPPRASIIEHETSHILSTLCRGTPGCKAIGIYNRSGLAIALSSLGGTVAPLGFGDARWAELTAVPKDGAIRPVTAAEAEGLAPAAHALVAIPAEHGVAICIIER